MTNKLEFLELFPTHDWIYTRLFIIIIFFFTTLLLSFPLSAGLELLFVMALDFIYFSSVQLVNENKFLTPSPP